VKIDKEKTSLYRSGIGMTAAEVEKYINQLVFPVLKNFKIQGFR
jgi:HSP90 family molecular chaperone